MPVSKSPDTTEALGAVKVSLDNMVSRLDSLDQSSMWHRRIIAGMVALVVAVGGLGFAGWWDDRNDDRAERRQVAEEARATCERGNESRAIIRTIAKDAALEVGESIIQVATASAERQPDPAIIEQFRQVMNQRLTAIVNKLEDRQCDA